jgi:hypothetical protein
VFDPDAGKERKYFGNHQDLILRVQGYKILVPYDESDSLLTTFVIIEDAEQFIHQDKS